MLCSSLLQVSRFLQHAEFQPGELLMRQVCESIHIISSIWAHVTLQKL